MGLATIHSDCISEERTDEFFGMENLQILHTFTKTDIFHGYPELVADADYHASFGSAVEFCYGESVDFGGGHKLAGLFESVLTGGTVEHQKNLLRSIGHYTLHNILYLCQLLHQADLVVEPAGRIYNDYIGALRLCR